MALDTLTPYVQADIASLPVEDGFLQCPPLRWHVMASDLNAESGTGLDNARWIEPTGDIEGSPQPALEDTYLTGTGSRTGRAFSAVAGTWKDDVVSPWSDRYELYQPDSSLSYWEVLQTTPTAGLTHALAIIRMGIAQAGNTTAHTPSGSYAALELANGSSTNYRIVLEFGSPIRLDYIDTVATNGAWTGVAYARDLGNVESYLAHHNGEVRLTIKPDLARGLLLVEIGDGKWLRHAAPRPQQPTSVDQPGSLPSIERYRLYGAYRSVQFEVQPILYNAPTINKASRFFGNDRLQNVGNASVRLNATGSSDALQAWEATPAFDGQGGLGYSLAVTNAAATTPPRVADVLIDIPAIWTVAIQTGGPKVVRPPVASYRELQVWDDATRIGSTSGRILINNSRGQYAGAQGNFAVNILTGNGITYGQRIRGVLGCDPDGIKLTRQDPWSYVDAPVVDFFAKMDVPLQDEVVLDGECIYSAVRFLAQKGNIHPKFLAFIPDVGPPPYGSGFPYYILGKGTGLNPRYRFGPERTVLSVLQELVQDSVSVDAWTGVATPHYMFFDVYGNFHWEPYNAAYAKLKKWYSDADTTPGGQIWHIDVYNSVAQMRTEVVLQGQDAFTYELMQYGLSLPLNWGAVGYRFPSLDRSGRYATPAYMQALARTAAVQASLPTTVVRMLVAHDPNLYAGDVIGISETKALGRAMVANVLEIESTLTYDNLHSTGEPVHGVCLSWITARDANLAIPF